MPQVAPSCLAVAGQLGHAPERKDLQWSGRPQQSRANAPPGPWPPGQGPRAAGERNTLRSGADDRPYRAVDFDVVDAVCAVAGDRSLPPAQIALGWLLTKPGVTAPIVGATKAHHLDDAIAALELTMTDDEVARLEWPHMPHSDGHYT